jgi:hypothetical protein
MPFADRSIGSVSFSEVKYGKKRRPLHVTDAYAETLIIRAGQKKRLLSYDVSYHKHCGRLSLELQNSCCLKENEDASQKRTRLAMTRSATGRAPGRGDVAQGALLQDARGHGGSFVSSGQDRTSLQVITPEKK